MGKFVNRDDELMVIDEAVDTLLDRKRLLRTPIIEFYGVEGMGKTTLLKKIEEHCNQKSVTKVWADGHQSDFHFIHTLKEILKDNQPVVAIFDSLDDANEDQLREIEAGLSDLIENRQLFVVLSSRRILRFDKSRAIARKLTTFPLKPLDRESCKVYLEQVDRKIIPEIRDIIFNWTRGYPLAMEAMVQAILVNNFDPRQEQQHKLILSHITRKVIDNGLFSKLPFSERDKFQILFSVLSVPRRFNLVIMQDIIEKYAPEYKLESSLAYITLPNIINQVPNVLSWNLLWAGYCLDMAVRNIFLLKLKIEDTQRYFAINRFLADTNERFAREVTGSDQVRYLREYFYHLANSGDVPGILSIIKDHLEPLTREKSLDSFLQFYEEFLLDEELKEALGEHFTSDIISFVRRKFVEKYIRDSEMSISERVHYLRDFFVHTARDSKVDDFPLIFEVAMRQIIQEESSDVSIKLFYEELLQDEGLKELLGEDYSRISALIYEGLTEEG